MENVAEKDAGSVSGGSDGRAAAMSSSSALLLENSLVKGTVCSSPAWRWRSCVLALGTATLEASESSAAPSRDQLR